MRGKPEDKKTAYARFLSVLREAGRQIECSPLRGFATKSKAVLEFRNPEEAFKFYVAVVESKIGKEVMVQGVTVEIILKKEVKA